MLIQVQWPIRKPLCMDTHALQLVFSECFQRLNRRTGDLDVVREGLCVAAVGAIEQLPQRMIGLPCQVCKRALVQQSADFFHWTEFVFWLKDCAHVNAPVSL
jgi:hypothetical protein